MSSETIAEYVDYQPESPAAIAKAREELAVQEAKLGVPSLAQLMHEVETAVVEKHGPYNPQ